MKSNKKILLTLLLTCILLLSGGICIIWNPLVEYSAARTLAYLSLSGPFYHSLDEMKITNMVYDKTDKSYTVTLNTKNTENKVKLIFTKTQNGLKTVTFYNINKEN